MTTVSGGTLNPTHSLARTHSEIAGKFQLSFCVGYILEQEASARSC